MSDGRIVNCWCGRLIIAGQACVCQPRPESDCDCRNVGNREIAGPECGRREAEGWFKFMRSRFRVQRGASE